MRFNDDLNKIICGLRLCPCCDKGKMVFKDVLLSQCIRETPYPNAFALVPFR